MAEVNYAFIKNNRVVNVAVFAQKDDELAETVVAEQEYDAAVFVNNTPPSKYSSYDGKTFTAPTIDYLIEIGVMDPFPTPEE